MSEHEHKFGTRAYSDTISTAQCLECGAWDVQANRSAYLISYMPGAQLRYRLSVRATDKHIAWFARAKDASRMVDALCEDASAAWREEASA